MFDEPTRAANQINLREFGDALAGRGTSINEAIVALDPLTKNAIPVLQQPRRPADALGALVPRARADGRRRRARRASSRASCSATSRSTFDAFDAIARPVPAGHDQRRPGGARHGDPLVPDPAAAARRTRPASSATCSRARPRCARPAPLLAEAFDVGTTQVRRAASLNDELALTLRSLQAFAQDPQVPLGIHGLRRTVEELTPTVNHLAGAQINCNYLALLLNNAASIQSDGDAADQGTWLRVFPVAAADRRRTARSARRPRRPTGRHDRRRPTRQPPPREPVPARRREGSGRHLHGRQRDLRPRPDA